MLSEKIADLLDQFKEDYLTKDLAKPFLSIILKATVKNCSFKKRKNHFSFYTMTTFSVSIIHLQLSMP